MLSIGFLLLGVCGCQKGQAPAEPPPQATKPATPQSALPKLPDQAAKAEDETPTGMEIVVANPADPRSKQPGYRQDDKCPVGRLVGVVRFAGPLIRREQLPPARKLETPEALGIPNPKPGEVDYFLNTKLAENRYIHHDFVQPIQVVLMVRGIQSGKRAMITRPTFLIRQGQFRPLVQFSPPHERVMFGTYDAYPTDVQIQGLAGGKRLMDAEVSAYDQKNIRPLPGGGVELKAPQMAQSDVIHELGGYRITSRRHPWKKAFLFVVDNPYALVADGGFTIGDLPVGTWQMDVWHPIYKPAKTTLQVEIKQDVATEVAVELEPPDYLRAGAPE